MKTESNVLYIIRLAVTLLIITSLVAGALACVNAITEPRIIAAKEAKTQEAINAVLEGGGQAIPFTDDTGLVVNVYASEKGYAVQVCPSGFNGQMDMMVGIDPEGNVTAISIISHTETAGLGAVAAADTAAGDAFRSQFAGLSGTLAVTKDGGEIDALTGATITSRAVTAGVNAALACVEKLG
ncbi:MAG: FMN-binding protein [Oscillospiraceae bacterium]|nr:FMN-binding protein [Oscillospiraceae bacterium]